MKKIKSILTIFFISLLLNACSSIGEGLSGSKKKGSEEFLVEKKAPLVLPPSFGELPEPGKKIDNNKTTTANENASSIEEIINTSSSSAKSKRNNNSKSSVEQSIIDKINEQ